MPSIENTLDAADEVSDSLSGAELMGGWQGSTLTGAVGLQVIRASGTGDFEVRFEAGIHRASGTTFDTVATITQAEVNDPITLTIAPGMRYRFRVESIASGSSVVVLAN